MKWKGRLVHQISMHLSISGPPPLLPPRDKWTDSAHPCAPACAGSAVFCFHERRGGGRSWALEPVPVNAFAQLYRPSVSHSGSGVAGKAPGRRAHPQIWDGPLQPLCLGYAQGGAGLADSAAWRLLLQLQPRSHRVYRAHTDDIGGLQLVAVYSQRIRSETPQDRLLSQESVRRALSHRRAHYDSYCSWMLTSNGPVQNTSFLQSQSYHGQLQDQPRLDPVSHARDMNSAGPRDFEFIRSNECRPPLRFGDYSPVGQHQTSSPKPLVRRWAGFTVISTLDAVKSHPPPG